MARPLIRFGLSLPFAAAIMALAFSAGTYLGGKFLVPAGQGLAAPAEAMGYGLLAAVIALALAIYAAVKMPMRALVFSALAGLLVCGLLGAGLILGLRKASAERDADIRSLQTPRTATQAVEPACPSSEGDTTSSEPPPCPNE